MEPNEIIMTVSIAIFSLSIWSDIFWRVYEYMKNKKDRQKALKDIINQMNEYSEDSGSIIMMLLSYIDEIWLHQKLGIIISEFSIFITHIDIFTVLCRGVEIVECHLTRLIHMTIQLDGSLRCVIETIQVL